MILGYKGATTWSDCAPIPITTRVTRVSPALATICRRHVTRTVSFCGRATLGARFGGHLDGGPGGLLPASLGHLVHAERPTATCRTKRKL